MALTKIKTGSVSDSITLTTPDINTPDIDGGTIDGTVIGGAIPAAISGTTITATVANANPKLKAAYNATNYMGISHEKINVQGGGVGLIIQGNGVDRATFASGGGLNLANGDLTVSNGQILAKGGEVANLSIASSVDGNTGLYWGGGDILGVVSGGTENVRYKASETIFNEGSADIDFRVESDNSTHALFVEGSSGNVGIGKSVPVAPAHVYKNSGLNTTVELLRLDCGDTTHQGGKGGKIVFRDISVYNSTAEIIARRDGVTSSSFLEFSLRDTVRMKIDSGGKIAIGNNIPLWSGSYGGALILKGNNSTSARHAKICVVNSTGAVVQQGMTIDNSGNAFFGKTSDAFNTAGTTIRPIGNTNISVANNTCLHLNRLGNVGKVAEFYNSGNVKGHITISSSGATYNSGSDYRLKENVVPMSGSIDRIKALKPSRFNWIADADNTVDGFIAHEAQAVVPESVTGTKDAMKDEEYEVTAAVEEVRDADGNITTEASEAVMGTRSVPDMQGIDQSKLVPLLVAALQEAVVKIEELTARITALEGE